MADGRYVRFEPKYDDANQVISAKHINVLQDTSERTQQGIFRASDRDFLDKALFVLDHHRVVNGMWIDIFENTSKIDLPRSSGLVFSEVEQAVVFPDGSEAVEGWLYSKPYINPNGSNMKQVMVIATTYIPENTNITIEISNNNADWYEISLSNSELFTIPTDGTRLQLRAKFTRSVGTTESPRLDAWAILFRDPFNEIIKMPDGSEIIIKPENPLDPNDPNNGGGYHGILNIMHNQLMGIGPDDHHPQEHSHDGTDGSGLIKHGSLIEVGPDDHHPKAHYHGEDGVPYVRLDTDVIGTLPLENLSYQLWTGKPGTTGLYFDPKLGDKLVYVKTPDDETYLFYDLKNDRLSHTITIVQGIAVWEDMIFDTYINSNGETTTVLKGTEKRHYDANDDVIKNEISLITAPAKPIGLIVQDPGTGNSLNLSWVANLEVDVVGYNVYRTQNKGITWTLLNTAGLVTQTNFIDSSVTTGIEYGYAITAVDATGYESEKSEMITQKATYVDHIAPDQVKNLVANRVLAGEIHLSWMPNTEPDLSLYRIYGSDSGTQSTFSLLGTVSAGNNLFVHTGLNPGDMYYYYVTAVDISGNESVRSIIVSAIA